MKKYFPFVLAAGWLVAVSIGLGALWVYEDAPGGDTNVPIHWPAQSKISQAPGRPTLIMFAHPHCPCTRASIGELSLLMTHCQNRVNATVVFLRPNGSVKDWTRTDLWRSAEAIPGVTVRTDEEGAEAGRFRVTTSGHVVLYDVGGELIFSGGITSSRGHYGDNDGLSAVTQLLHNEMADARKTPVFGCSLVDPKQKCTEKDAVCPH